MSLKTEPDRYTLALKVEWDKQTAYSSGGYVHLIGTPVLLDKSDRTNNETLYGDIAWHYYGDDKWMESLQLHSQGVDSDRPRKLYAWSIRYRDLYSVELQQAELMAKTLKRLEAGMDKLYAQWGACDAYSDYLLRAAKVMKVACCLFPRRNYDGLDYKYRVTDVGRDAKYAIDSMIRDWSEAANKEQSAVA